MKNIINTRQTIDFKKFKQDFKLHKSRIAVIRKYSPIENRPLHVFNKTVIGGEGSSAAEQHLSKITENNHENYDSFGRKTKF